MTGVVDHVGLRVSDLPASRRIYEGALAELGFSVLGEGDFEGDGYVLFGRPDSDDFALHAVGGKPSAAFVLDLDGNNVEAVFHTPLPRSNARLRTVARSSEAPRPARA